MNLNNNHINGFVIFLTILIIIVIYKPNMLSHTDNYIKANSLITPVSIVIIDSLYYII